MNRKLSFLMIILTILIMSGIHYLNNNDDDQNFKPSKRKQTHVKKNIDSLIDSPNQESTSEKSKETPLEDRPEKSSEDSEPLNTNDKIKVPSVLDYSLGLCKTTDYTFCINILSKPNPNSDHDQKAYVCISKQKDCYPKENFIPLNESEYSNYLSPMKMLDYEMEMYEINKYIAKKEGREQELLPSHEMEAYFEKRRLEVIELEKSH